MARAWSVARGTALVAVAAVSGCLAIDWGDYRVASSSAASTSSSSSGAGGGAPSVCGNGITEPGEQCDDGNLTPVDGCSPTCRIDKPDSCPGTEVPLSPPGITINGTLVGMVDNFSPGCGAPAMPDVVYAVTPTVTGTLTVTLSGGGLEKSMTLRSFCAPTGPIPELSCTQNTTSAPLTLSMWVTAGTTYYVVVDGDPAAFTLAMTLGECGDGKVDGLEQCDSASCPGCVACTNAGEFWDATKKRCYRVTPTSQTWAAARASCVAWGGDLAGVSSQEELDFLRIAPAVTNQGDLWLSGYSLSPACSFVWADREPWFENGWAATEPNNTNGNELCVMLYGFGGHFMADVNCAVPKHALCERAPKGTCGDGVIQEGEECDDALSTPGSCSGCRVTCSPDEFRIALYHHCYRLFTGADRANFNGAMAACSAAGGHLATISSSTEVATGKTNLKSDTWIGASQAAQMPNTPWTWTNGEPFCFANWAIGKPTPDASYCVASLPDGTWANEDCTVPRDFLCEREP